MQNENPADRQAVAGPGKPVTKRRGNRSGRGVQKRTPLKKEERGKPDGLKIAGINWFHDVEIASMLPKSGFRRRKLHR
jgi:hypothetical protein